MKQNFVATWQLNILYSAKFCIGVLGSSLPIFYEIYEINADFSQLFLTPFKALWSTGSEQPQFQLQKSLP